MATSPADEEEITFFEDDISLGTNSSFGEENPQEAFQMHPQGEFLREEFQVVSQSNPLVSHGTQFIENNPKYVENNQVPDSDSSADNIDFFDAYLESDGPPSPRLSPQRTAVRTNDVPQKTASPLLSVSAAATSASLATTATASLASDAYNSISDMDDGLSSISTTTSRSNFTVRKFHLPSKPKYFESVLLELESETKAALANAITPSANPFNLPSSPSPSPPPVSQNPQQQQQQQLLNQKQSNLQPPTQSSSSRNSAQSIYYEIIQAKIRQQEHAQAVFRSLSEKTASEHSRSSSDSFAAPFPNPGALLHPTAPQSRTELQKNQAPQTRTNANLPSFQVQPFHSDSHQNANRIHHQQLPHLQLEPTTWIQLILPALPGPSGFPKEIVFHIPPPPKSPPPPPLATNHVFPSYVESPITNSPMRPSIDSNRNYSQNGIVQPSVRIPYDPSTSSFSPRQPTSPAPFIPPRKFVRQSSAPIESPERTASSQRLNSLGIFDPEPKARPEIVQQLSASVPNIDLVSFETPAHVRAQRVQTVNSITGPKLVSTSSRVRTIPIDLIRRDLKANGRWNPHSENSFQNDPEEIDDPFMRMAPVGVESDPTGFGGISSSSFANDSFMSDSHRGFNSRR